MSQNPKVTHQALLWGVSPHHTHKYTTIKTYGLSNEFPRLEKWKACIHGGNFNSPLLIYRPHTASHGAVVSICFLSVCRTGLCRICNFLLDGLIKIVEPGFSKPQGEAPTSTMRCITPSHSQLHNHQNIWTVQWNSKIGEVEGMHPWWQLQFPFCWLTGLTQPAMEQGSQSVFYQFAGLGSAGFDIFFLMG